MQRGLAVLIILTSQGKSTAWHGKKRNLKQLILWKKVREKERKIFEIFSYIKKLYTHIEYELDGMHRKVKIIIALKSVSQSVTEIFLSPSLSLAER